MQILHLTTVMFPLKNVNTIKMQWKLAFKSCEKKRKQKEFHLSSEPVWERAPMEYVLLTGDNLNFSLCLIY